MKQAAIPLLVLLVIVGLAILTSWPSSSLEADHYRKFQDGKSLYAVVSSRIQSGDALEVVESVLGPATPMTEGVTEFRSQLQQEALQFPERFPHGVYDSDTFATYAIENQRFLLQFRNGFLVNHNPEMFEEYFPPQDIAGAGAAGQVPLADPTDSEQATILAP